MNKRKPPGDRHLAALPQDGTPSPDPDPERADEPVRPTELVLSDDHPLVPSVRGMLTYNRSAAGSYLPDALGAKETYLRLTIGSSHPIEEAIGKPWPTEHVAVVIREAEDEGEVGAYIALCLVHPDGRFLATGSSVLIGQLQHLMLPEWYGPPPWRPALNLVIERQRSKSGRTYYTLRVEPPG